MFAVQFFLNMSKITLLTPIPPILLLAKLTLSLDVN